MDLRYPEITRHRYKKPLAAIAGLGLAMSLGGCVEDDPVSAKQKSPPEPSTFRCESVKYIANDTRSDYVYVSAVDKNGSETRIDSVTTEALESNEQAKELTPVVNFNNQTDVNRYEIDIRPDTSQLVIKLHKGDEIARCPTLDSPLRPFNPPTPEPTKN